MSLILERLLVLKPNTKRFVDSVGKNYHRVQCGLGTAHILALIDLEGMLKGLAGNHEFLGHPKQFLS